MTREVWIFLLVRSCASAVYVLALFGVSTLVASNLSVDVRAMPIADEHAALEVESRIGAWRRSSRGARGMFVLEPLLDERIREIRGRSPTFDAAWQALERSSVPILIGTEEQLRDQLPRHLRGGMGWAGMTLNWGDGSNRLVRSAVAIRLDWLEELHGSFGNDEETFRQALDQLLIHELYGHLVPMVEAGHLRASCADPGPDERLEDSCVGQRELAIRAETAGHYAAYTAR